MFLFYAKLKVYKKYASYEKKNYSLLGLYTNTSNGCIIEIHESLLYILAGGPLSKSEVSAEFESV